MVAAPKGRVSDMRVSLGQLQRRLLLLFSLYATLVACVGEAQPDGFCLFDSQCNEGLCDPTTRRCVRTSDQGYLTDAELDRKLDMMVVDAMVVDATTTDFAVPDAQALSPTQPDQSLRLLDARLPADVGLAPEPSTDAQVSRDGEVDTSGNDQLVPAPASSDAGIEGDSGNEPESADAVITDPT